MSSVFGQAAFTLNVPIYFPQGLGQRGSVEFGYWRTRDPELGADERHPFPNSVSSGTASTTCARRGVGTLQSLENGGLGFTAWAARK